MKMMMTMTMMMIPGEFCGFDGGLLGFTAFFLLEVSSLKSEALRRYQLDNDWNFFVSIENPP